MIQKSSRGEVIGFLTLALSALVWFGQDRQDKGALLRTNDMNATLLAQRNRELDQVHAEINALALQVRNCNP